MLKQHGFEKIRRPGSWKTTLSLLYYKSLSSVAHFTQKEHSCVISVDKQNKEVFSVLDSIFLSVTDFCLLQNNPLAPLEPGCGCQCKVFLWSCRTMCRKKKHFTWTPFSSTSKPGSENVWDILPELSMWCVPASNPFSTTVDSDITLCVRPCATCQDVPFIKWFLNNVFA